jgi:hypothetical protein
MALPAKTSPPMLINWRLERLGWRRRINALR